MKRTVVHGLMVSFAAIALASAAYAKDSAKQEANKDPAEAAFVADYIAAINAKDTDKLLALIHPKARECINDKTRAFFDEAMKGTLRHHVPDSATSKIVAQSRMEYMLPPALFSWPVKPTHAMQIEFIDPEVVKRECKGSLPRIKCGHVTLLRAVAKSEGKYYEVQGCPNDKGVEAFAKAREVQQKRAEKILAIYRDMDKEMKDDLVKKLAAGNTLSDVAKYYEMKAKLTFFEANEVMKLIQEERMR